MIVAQGLSKKFKDVTAVENVSFEAKAGEVFGLLGPNGAGKTTTLRLLSTVLRPTSGTATIAGFDVHRDPIEVRRRLGMLTAAIGLYGRFTARENIAYFGRLHGMSPEAIRKRTDELIAFLDMAEFADRRAENFSTGMKQRVAIARAIVHDPPVVIFDEPTAGLDLLAARLVLEFMRFAKTQGKCVILSTHHMHEAEALCDRVAIVHQAHLIADDTVTALKAGTGTASLEQAFMALVHPSPALPPGGKP